MASPCYCGWLWPIAACPFYSFIWLPVLVCLDPELCELYTFGPVMLTSNINLVWRYCCPVYVCLQRAGIGKHFVQELTVILFKSSL